MKRGKYFVLILLSLLCIENVFSQNPQIDPHWQKCWEDDFLFLNYNNWMVCNNRIHNNSPQLFKDYNIWSENGNLVIRVNNQQDTCPHNISPQYPNCVADSIYTYTSGRVETMPEYAIQYGYVEARIKVPYHEGLWPAFWTLIKQGLHLEEPDHTASEIDIFEMYANKGTNHLETNLHHAYDYTESNTAYLQEHDLNNFSYTDWHKYAIEWDPVKIIWYVDDTPIRTTYNHGILDPVRLIMNIAVAKGKGLQPETSPYFEEKMLVDYVKVYGLKCDKHTTINEIPDFSAYDYKVKKSITLGSGTTIPTGTDISLRANNFIELRPGFEVPSDGRLYLDVSPCQGGITINP